MSYATLDEFVRLLRLDSPSDDALAAAQRALDSATSEIDSYLAGVDRPPPFTFTPEQQALVTQVNLDRATEHWRSTPFGTLAQGPDTVPVFVARNSWYRHARSLDSLKESWGFA